MTSFIRGACLALVVVAGAAVPAVAQDPAPAPAPAAASPAAADPQTVPPPATPVDLPEGKLGLKLFAHDFKKFFSKDTAQVMGIMAVASIAAVPWDRLVVEEAPELTPSGFKAGNIGGGVAVQAGFGLALWLGGRARGSDTLTSTGRDIIRAEILSQVLVQGVKFIVRRPRPDGSNNYSFPSGHSASAFATAMVLQRHLGWKAGVPAFAFAGYVGAARMSANKHHISDVVMGAGFGLASARTVTLHLKGAPIAVGVTPTPGGAAIMFARIPR